MSLITRLRLRARDKALAASRQLSTGPEWERHVRKEFALLAPPPGWRDSVVDGFHRLYYDYDTGYSGGTWADTRWFGVPALRRPRGPANRRRHHPGDVPGGGVRTAGQ
jgi:hypothetical protein